MNKWPGTLPQAILFGLIGGEGLTAPNGFLLTVGLLCSLLDIVNILLPSGKLRPQPPSA